MIFPLLVPSMVPLARDLSRLSFLSLIKFDCHTLHYHNVTMQSPMTIDHLQYMLLWNLYTGEIHGWDLFKWPL